jgi:hypothetical protein
MKDGKVRRYGQPGGLMLRLGVSSLLDHRAPLRGPARRTFAPSTAMIIVMNPLVMTGYLGCENTTYLAGNPVLGLELLEGLEGVVDETEAGRLATTEGRAETKDDHLGLVLHVVHLLQNHGGGRQ